MKYLIVISDLILDDIKERYPYIEEKPIIKPLFTDENGNSAYLTQDYVDALYEKTKQVVIGHLSEQHIKDIADILQYRKKEE